MGVGGALFAMALVMTWMPIRGITFAPGRIDHHNLQILLTTTMAMAMVLPGRAGLTGAVAGCAAALSLAIGLETLVFVAVGGLVLVLRAAFEAEGAKARLLGFCLALLCGAAGLFAGQTAPQDWLTPHCDALATPVLAVILIATGSSLAPQAAGRQARPHDAGAAAWTAPGSACRKESSCAAPAQKAQAGAGSGSL